MDNDDLRRALIAQVELFGSEAGLARALGMKPEVLYEFLRRQPKTKWMRRTNTVHRALGLELETKTVQTLKPKETL